MEESVIYQDIIQKGELRGKKKEALELISRQLKRRFGNVQSSIEPQLRALSLEQLENLAEELLDFKNQNDLVNYLANIPQG
jgi:predicted transposase YdaD